MPYSGRHAGACRTLSVSVLQWGLEAAGGVHVAVALFRSRRQLSHDLTQCLAAADRPQCEQKARDEDAARWERLRPQLQSVAFDLLLAPFITYNNCLDLLA